MSNDLKLETDLPSEPGFLDFIGSSMSADDSVTATGLLNAYVPVFVVAFLVTLLVTPIIRSIAVQGGVVDTPDGDRKLRKFLLDLLLTGTIHSHIVNNLVHSTSQNSEHAPNAQSDHRQNRAGPQIEQ